MTEEKIMSGQRVVQKGKKQRYQKQKERQVGRERDNNQRKGNINKNK